MKTALLIFLLILVILPSAAAAVSDFAVEVVDAQGTFGPWPYDDPNAVLGRPATRCINNDPMTTDPTFRVKLVEGAYNLDLDEKKIITTITQGDSIIVKFDHKVMDFPLNPYGQDFIVFGNLFFTGSGNVSDSANLNTYTVAGGGHLETVRVSVSQGGDLNDPNAWHIFTDGPYADGLFPTQAYRWSRENAQWTDIEMDFTKPVDPNLTFEDFSGISAADAIDLYDGSGGGTPFDLKDLPDYDDLTIDPNSGCRWVQYIRFDDVDTPEGAEIDAVSDVAVCGDPTYPFPAGDITKDCRVDLWDLAILAGTWLDCTYRCD